MYVRPIGDVHVETTSMYGNLSLGASMTRAPEPVLQMTTELLIALRVS